MAVSTIPNPTSPPETGFSSCCIAVLVLLCFLILVLLLVLLWRLIFYYRRKHRGSMDLLIGQASYHPMNEEPAYQTHGRFAPSGNKQTPYDAGQPNNGTKPISCTKTCHGR